MRPANTSRECCSPVLCLKVSKLLKLRDNYLEFSGIFKLNQSHIVTKQLFSALFAYALPLVCLAVCTLYVLLYDNNIDNNNNTVNNNNNSN